MELFLVLLLGIAIGIAKFLKEKDEPYRSPLERWRQPLSIHLGECKKNAAQDNIERRIRRRNRYGR